MRSHRLEDYCRVSSAFTQRSQQKVLRAHLVVTQAVCLFGSETQGLPQGGRHHELDIRWRMTRWGEQRDGISHALRLQTHLAEQRAGEAAGFIHQPQQQMLRAEIVVAQASSGSPGMGQHSPGFFAESGRLALHGLARHDTPDSFIPTADRREPASSTDLSRPGQQAPLTHQTVVYAWVPTRTIAMPNT